MTTFFELLHFQITELKETFMKKADSKEILTSITKSAFSLIPYAGTALTELIFEYNGRLKQNRLNNFVELLAEGFTNNNEIELGNIKTEHFNDLFEAVIKRVFTTKSKLKLKRFRDIIIKQLQNPTDEFELIDVYLDLVTNLSEDELFILHEHRHFDKKYSEELIKRDELRDKISIAIENEKQEIIATGQSKYLEDIKKLETEIEIIKNKHDKLKHLRNSTHYNISEDRFLYYKQRLYSQALLIDTGIGRIGVDTFQMMSITEFGSEFIDFIKNANS